MNLRDRAITWRSRRRLSQQEVASRIGLSRNAYWRFETGKGNLSRPNERKLEALMADSVGSNRHPPQEMMRDTAEKFVNTLAAELHALADTVAGEHFSGELRGRRFAEAVRLYGDALEEYLAAFKAIDRMPPAPEPKARDAKDGPA